ncbi:MAG: hypothetical protein KME50_12950 [Nostoc desertorum CM1-VF14]|jgi:hypothetical protein|nr:hypothetical protein [Nostoc desertorum CM1-VF14]
MFPDRFKPHDTYYWALQNIKDVVDFYRYDALPGLSQIREWAAPSLTINYDPCNFSIDYKFPFSEGNDNIWQGGGLPRIKIDIRNQYCQPPPKPTPPPGNGFYVGGKCNCDISVVFAFYEKDFILSPGAGIGKCLIDGSICPSNLREQSQQSGDFARHRFELHDKNLIIRFKLPYSVNDDGIPTGDGITVFYCTLFFTYAEVLENNGYVNPAFPRFHNFRNWGLPNQEAVLDVAPWQVVAINCRGCAPNIYIDPPPPPKKKEKKDMDCCAELRALLKLTLKRIGSLPANVPDNFAKQNPSMVSKESLAELMLWQMEQLDALSGAYPIEIEIEDSDLVQAGNQKQKVSLPNQAEALAELIGMVLTVKRDTHANLITSIKAMGEAGMSKQLAVKTLDVSLANAEYLGYKLEQKKKEIPSLFTPGGKDITETLKEKNIEIITYENTDKKDLQDNLKTLLEFAARWNAQNWRRVGSNAAKDLLQHLLVKPEETTKATKENDQDDFNKFTEEIERGFIDVTGTTTDAQPWGRPYKERPKIKELKNEKGRYGKDD